MFSRLSQLPCQVNSNNFFWNTGTRRISTRAASTSIILENPPTDLRYLAESVHIWLENESRNGFIWEEGHARTRLIVCLQA